MGDPPVGGFIGQAYWQRPRRALARIVARLIIVGVVILAFAGTLGDAAMGVVKGQGQCRVIKIIDGDTVSIWCLGESARRARLLGFDAPEVFSPKCKSEWWRGIRATYALRGQLWAAGTITIQTAGSDRYGRVLVDLAVDGTSVGKPLIARALARSYSGGMRGTWCG